MEPNFDLPPITLPEIKFYLYYDDEGNILELLNYKKDNEKYIEVNEDFVIEFRESKKEFHSYKLKIDKNPIIVRKIENIRMGQLVRIMASTDDSELLVSVSKGKVKFKLRHPDYYSTISDDFQHYFFIVDNNELNFLKETIIIKHEKLKDGYEINYSLDTAKEILFVKKYFDSYGIINE